MKTKALIVSAFLILGLTSCTKEEDMTPATDTNALVDQRMAQAQEGRNPFKGKEFMIMIFTQNKADKPTMRKIRIKFNESGIMEAKGQGAHNKASWAYNNLGKKLMIRSNGRNPIMNQLSSDVWEVTERSQGRIHLKAVHFEMVKEMDIIEVNAGDEPASDTTTL